MLLNSKSIINCNEIDEVEHNQEIEYIIKLLYNFPNYDCLVIKQYYDGIHQIKENGISVVDLYDILSTLETVDIKNGVDFTIGDNNILTIEAFGQGFQYDGKFGYKKTLIRIMPYNEENEFLDISTKLLKYINDETIIN